MVVVGGGFVGLRAVRALRDAPVEVTLIDRRNFHLFQPLLWPADQVGLERAELVRSSPGVAVGLELVAGQVVADVAS